MQNHQYMIRMKRLTPKEEAVLNTFWKHGPMLIRELLELQEEPKPHYNTLSSLVRVLEKKGYIGYKAYGNTYQYYALLTEDEYRKSAVGQLVDKYFGKSYTRMVSALVEDEKISVKKLQKLIDQIKNKS